MLQSSAETVVNLEELLTEILVRVPAFPLVLSKHWHSLISNPKFLLRHATKVRNPKPAFSVVFTNTSQYLSLVSFPPHNNLTSTRWNPLNVIAKEHGHVMIMSSCNGLLLCRHPYGKNSTYYVLNPTTNQFLKLDDAPKTTQEVSRGIWGCTLAFDPSKSSSHYKVICSQSLFQQHCVFNLLIYSSETQTWTKVSNPSAKFSLKAVKGYSSDLEHEGVYWNGAFHWQSQEEEDDGNLLYYHIEQECVKFYKRVILKFSANINLASVTRSRYQAKTILAGLLSTVFLVIFGFGVCI